VKDAVAALSAKNDALAAELQRAQDDFKQRLAAKDEETARLLADARAGRAVAMTSSENRARDQARSLFTAGMSAYSSRRFDAAEAAFEQATRVDGTDALMWYFLGLAQFQQGKVPDAAFRKGGELEARGLPNSRVVGDSLEGVYGPARKALSAFRP
jgi:tetratricopeptide (TPR) repeat protein